MHAAVAEEGTLRVIIATWMVAIDLGHCLLWLLVDACSMHSSGQLNVSTWLPTAASGPA